MRKKTKATEDKELVRMIYTIEEIVRPDGTCALRRTAHGVDAHRLHSILIFATNDVARQIAHELPPPQRFYKDR